jgi:hypothetical protein
MEKREKDKRAGMCAVLHASWWVRPERVSHSVYFVDLTNALKSAQPIANISTNKVRKICEAQEEIPKNKQDYISIKDHMHAFQFRPSERSPHPT